MDPEGGLGRSFRSHETNGLSYFAPKRICWRRERDLSRAKHYLDLLEARELVTATTSADDVAHTKPAPDIFAAALSKVAPVVVSEVIVVGDTPYDIQAARECGIDAVALRSGGFADATLAAVRPAAVYDGVAALLAAYAAPLAA